MAEPDNELKDLTVAELKGVAAMFAVDLDGFTKKADIIKEIEENGITWDMYKSMLQPEEDEIVLEEEGVVLKVEPDAEDAQVVVDEPVDEQAEADEDEPVDEQDEEDSDEILVKMTRKNYSYQIRGYSFSRQHPFVLVKSDDADYLIEVEGGFRTATPREAREFYGA